MMKTLTRTLLATAWLMFAGSIGVAAQTIVGSPHDLSTGNGGTNATDEVCVFCHTPHFAADAAASASPLWNRNDPVSTTFAMYSSPTLDMTIAADPQGISLACLSCHDGATALDSLINPPSGFFVTGALMTNPVAVVGVDGLTNDHPISVTYDAALDVGFNAAVAGKIGGSLPLFRAPGVTTGDGDQVECGSCHNPHDWSTHGQFLRVSNAASALCTLCHIK